MADNHLQHLPASMAGLVSLKQLWAYGNHLQSLPADILDLPAIRRELTAIRHLESFCPACFALCHASFAFCRLASPYLRSILTLSYHAFVKSTESAASSCTAQAAYDQTSNVSRVLITMSFMPQSLHLLLSSYTAVSSCELCVLHSAKAYFDVPCPAVFLLCLSVRPGLSTYAMLFLHALTGVMHLPTAVLLAQIKSL